MILVKSLHYCGQNRLKNVSFHFLIKLLKTLLPLHCTGLCFYRSDLTLYASKTKPNRNHHGRCYKQKIWDTKRCFIRKPNILKRNECQDSVQHKEIKRTIKQQ